MPSPPSRLEAEQRLLKILQQEARRGYDNGAVFGGLDRFLRNFVDRFPGESAVMDIILTLPSRGYGSLDPAERRAWADSLSSPPASSDSRRPSPSTSRQGTTAKDGPRARTPRGSGRALRGSELGLATAVSRLSIQTKTAEKIAKIKRPDGAIETVEDLITHWPFRHIDYGHLTQVAQLMPGDRTTLARVASVDQPWAGNRGRPIRAVLTDGFGRVDAVWFNQAWVAKQLKQGQQYVFSGRIRYFNGRPQFDNPEYEPENDETKEMIARGRLVPVYPSTAGLPQRTLRRAVKLALDGYLHLVPELLPAPVRQEA
ncbi:MAG: OB-fold nucleic acid binding domain-containing protein, partial [Planctomycetaceae bacterium]